MGRGTACTKVLEVRPRLACEKHEACSETQSLAWNGGQMGEGNEQEDDGSGGVGAS